jgi:hypothetical protein
MIAVLFVASVLAAIIGGVYCSDDMAELATPCACIVTIVLILIFKVGV